MPGRLTAQGGTHRYIKAAALVKANTGETASAALQALGAVHCDTVAEVSLKRGLLKVVLQDAFQSHNLHAAEAALVQYCNNDTDGGTL